MADVIHIYSSLKEIEEIFEEGLQALGRALECFMMIEKQDSGARLMVKNVYGLIRLGESMQDGFVPESVE